MSDAVSRFILTAQNRTQMGFSQAVDGLNNMGAQAKKLNAHMAALKGFVGLGMIGQFAHSVIRAGDEIGDLSERTGFGVESIQSLKIVADDTGIRIDRLVGMLNNLQAKMNESLVEGGEKSAEAFAKLGVSMEAIRAGNVEAVFEQLAVAMAANAGNAEITAAAQDVLGSSVQKLAPVFKAAAGGMAELNNEMKRNGEIFSDEQIERLSRADRTLTKWSNKAKVLAVETAESFIGHIGYKDMQTAAAKKAKQKRAMTPEEVEKEGVGVARGPRAPRRGYDSFEDIMSGFEQVGREVLGAPEAEREAEMRAMAEIFDRRFSMAGGRTSGNAVSEFRPAQQAERDEAVKSMADAITRKLNELIEVTRRNIQVPAVGA